MKSYPWILSFNLSFLRCGISSSDVAAVKFHMIAIRRKHVFVEWVQAVGPRGGVAQGGVSPYRLFNANKS